MTCTQANINTSASVDDQTRTVSFREELYRNIRINSFQQHLDRLCATKIFSHLELLCLMIIFTKFRKFCPVDTLILLFELDIAFSS